VTEAHAGAREQVLAAAEAIWQRVRRTELDRVAVLESATAALQAGRLDEDGRARAEREAHKIAGSPGRSATDGRPRSPGSWSRSSRPGAPTGTRRCSPATW
jgi:hypothetical protein